MRLWGGRFSEETDPRVADFTRSIDIDRELAVDDLVGSMAHVHGLGRAGLLTPAEVRTLVAGLDGLRAEVEAGTIAWDPALEDVHLNLEAALAARIGPLAGKLHTGRSRNDQVATDMRLWLRRTIDRLDDGHRRRSSARSSAWPSATATRSCPARPTSSRPSRCSSPITCWPTSRCSSATAAGWPTPAPRLNVSPLGAGALAGAGYPLDRADDGRRARLRRGHRELARRGERPRLRRRVPGRGRAGHGPPQPAGRGDHLVVEPALRVRPGRRRLLDRLVDDAQQEEPRTRPSSSAAARPASSAR